MRVAATCMSYIMLEGVCLCSTYVDVERLGALNILLRAFLLRCGSVGGVFTFYTKLVNYNYHQH